MARCEQCGNDYDKSFEVKMGGRTMIFDSFECAIHRWRRSARIAAAASSGMGSQHGGVIYCCVHCARHEGVTGLRDRD